MPLMRTDYLSINRGGTPNTAGGQTGTYYVGQLLDAELLIGAPLLSDLGAAPAAPGPHIYIDDSASPPVIFWWDDIAGVYVSFSVQPMTGATAATNGAAGTVPAPVIGDEIRFLRGDGIWADVPDMTGATAATAGAHGLVPAPAAGEEGEFLRGDGTWASVPVMTGATAATAGVIGTVPAPAAGEEGEFLRGDGTWAAVPVMTGATAATAGATGTVPAPAAGEEGEFLRGDGTWATPAGAAAMTGATAATAGTGGTVPAPAAGEEGEFLRGDGTWAPVTAALMTGATATTAGASGSVPAPAAGEDDLFLRGDGTWASPSIGCCEPDYGFGAATAIPDPVLVGTYTDAVSTSIVWDLGAVRGGTYELRAYDLTPTTASSTEIIISISRNGGTTYTDIMTYAPTAANPASANLLLWYTGLNAGPGIGWTNLIDPTQVGALTGAVTGFRVRISANRLGFGSGSPLPLSGRKLCLTRKC